MRVAVYIEPWIKQRAGIGFYTAGLIEMLKASSQIQTLTVGSQRFSEDMEHIFLPQWKTSFFNPFRYTGFLTIDLKKWGVDVLIDPAHYATIGLFSGVPVVNVIHDLTPILFPKMHKLQSVIAHRFLLPASLKSAKKLITVSNHTLNDLKKVFPYLNVPIQTVYPVIRNLSGGPLPKEIPSKFFLCVGTIEPRKNHDRIIAVFSSIAQRNPEISLVIIGDNGWKTNIKASISKSLFRDRIYYLGYVSDEMLGALYHKAIALVYPSLYEGFGLPIIEAMRLSCCVITGNNSSLIEVAGDAALVVDPNSALEIERAMESLVSDVALQSALREKGLENAKRFDLVLQLVLLERLLVDCTD